MTDNIEAIAVQRKRRALHFMHDGKNGQSNDLRIEDQPAHAWYRFVLSYPPHLVRQYLEKFGVSADQKVLDPFCGTGTTLVECKKLGIASVGIEANPMAQFASQVKVDWSPDPDRLVDHARCVGQAATDQLQLQGIDDVSALQQPAAKDLKGIAPDRTKLLLTNSISPLPLHKSLVLLEAIDRLRDERFCRHERLAFAKALVFSFSNLAFGPEVGIGAIKTDAAVIGPWLAEIRKMAADLHELGNRQNVPAQVIPGDARQVVDLLEPESISAVITSPPYPNEKDYTRTTRLESVLLGLLETEADLREVKHGLVRSNTRSVYRQDEDDWWVADQPAIQRLVEEIENRRLELGKTSGFEKQYGRVTKLYFGGMARHLASLRRALRPGARLAYVVGDQASYFRVLIRTGQLLAGIAESLGYEVTNIDLFRTRLATATREQMREEVLLLCWPGLSAKHISLGADIMPRKKAEPKSEQYKPIIAHIFASHFSPGMREFEFEREEIISAAEHLHIPLPKNLGDVIYSFRYCADLPLEVAQTAPEGEAWTIQPAGRARYRFVLRALSQSPVHVVPNGMIGETKIPDATPGIIIQHALTDEQALLARLRYNRLIDIFTGITCYSLQNHLRTTVRGMGQVETDEIYVGVNRQGAQFVLPVQAKGGSDKINVVQLEQDYALCAEKFPDLLCIPIAAQFMEGDAIALFSFEQSEQQLVQQMEKHYRLVPPDEVTSDDLQQYRNRLDE